MLNKNTFKLNILFTSDIHGHLLAVNYADNSRDDKGLSLLATEIKKFDKHNTILIDLGDAIQGSPLMYYHQLNRDLYLNPVAKIFNYLNYNYFIPGNHDFNYGKKYLKDFIHQINAKTLCQNIYINNKLLFKQGFDIKIIKDVKILIIGVTTKYIPNWENPHNIKNYVFKDPVEEVKNIVSKYKKNVDLIVLGYHGGIERELQTGKEFVSDTGENQGYRLFKEIEDINIILTGHQHRIINEKINGRIIMQPGCNAANLGEIEVNFDENKNIVSLNSKLVKSKDLKEDKVCQNIIKNVEEGNQIFLDEVIGIVEEDDLLIKDQFKARLYKHKIVDFINQIQLKYSKAMISATSLANDITGFNKEITIRNVLSTYVFPNTLVVLKIDGKNLKEYLEKCAEYFIVENDEIVSNPKFSYPKMEHYNYDMLDGIDYTFDLKKSFGNRVVSLQYNNQEITEKDEFTLVLNNYRAAGGGDFLMLKDLPVVKEIPLDISELIISYIKEKKYLNITSKNNIKIIK